MENRAADVAPTGRTKAETLEFLQGILKTASILPLFYFTVSDWRENQTGILRIIKTHAWSADALVVRSSALCEDSFDTSLAGCFTSIVDVHGEASLIDAINTVIASYFDNPDEQHQILIQPMLQDVKLSGVAFSRDPNTGGPYLVVNYDDSSGSTTSITSGLNDSSKCYIWHKLSPIKPSGFLKHIALLVDELEAQLQSDSIDIEFAITNTGKIYLFQVRPLIINAIWPHTSTSHAQIIRRISSKIAIGLSPHPYLYGNKTVYGIMPDWNPAEIIGTRPRPLSLSLYRHVVTDSVWAYQRDNYGYNSLRSFPLLVDFEGLPYIDVRVSFNSFLPKGLPDELAERLVNYYVNRLIQNPALHDKVEFEIIFSCYTLDLKERLTILSDYGFTKQDQATLANALTELTNRIIHNQEGLWRKDLEKIHELERRQSLLFKSDLDPISKMYWILEDCKRFGTLPFAGLARAGFIAVQLLKSFVEKNIISNQEYADFFSSLDTVSSRISEDFQLLSKSSFLKKYGHLRPGTYDINSPRYDEEPNLYFDWKNKDKSASDKPKTHFSLRLPQLRRIQKFIDDDNLHTNVLDLLEFIKIAIESREYSKFVFSRSISQFLKLFSDYGKQFDLNSDDCSYININVLQTLYGSSADPKEILHHSIGLGKNQFSTTQSITLPPLLCAPEDAWAFHFPETMPNFITQKSSTGHVVFSDAPLEDLHGGILFIPNADPGFDWIFSHDIVGFITQFGGANSHMAIRAGELGIPAVIGAGETNYNQWSKARKLRLDASNKQVCIL